MKTKILVVEDDFTWQLIFKNLLKKWWYNNVTVAYRIYEALESIDQQLFEVLVCDTSLKDDTDWIKVAEAFRKKFPEGKIIAMSANEKFKDFWTWKCDIFISKAVIQEQLLDAVWNAK